MHVRSQQLLDLARTTAAGGMRVRYHGDRASPIAITAQNGLLLQLVMII
jgi:hypothetical protein